MSRAVAVSLILFVLSLAGSVQASVQAGVAAAVRGKVTVTRPDAVGREVESGSPIYLGDSIRTGEESGLQVLLLDETVFTLGPKSELVIDKFLYDAEAKGGELDAKLVRGAFRFISGRIAKDDPESMKVRLPSGTIGIRGTVVDTSVDPDTGRSLVVLAAPGAANLDTGAIEVANAGIARDVRRGGWGVEIPSFAEPPSVPFLVPAELYENFDFAVQGEPKEGGGERQDAERGPDQARPQRARDRSSAPLRAREGRGAPAERGAPRNDPRSAGRRGPERPGASDRPGSRPDPNRPPRAFPGRPGGPRPRGEERDPGRPGAEPGRPGPAPRPGDPLQPVPGSRPGEPTGPGPEPFDPARGGPEPGRYDPRYGPGPDGYGPGNEGDHPGPGPYDPNHTPGTEPYGPGPDGYAPDPGSYDPNYDPNYDPSTDPYAPGPDGYAPGPGPYDPNYDPNYDPSTDPYAPSPDGYAPGPYDPNYDPNYDPGAEGYVPGPDPYDPAGSFDPALAEYDPALAEFDPAFAEYDPAFAEYDPAFDDSFIFDPNAPEFFEFDPNDPNFVMQADEMITSVNDLLALSMTIDEVYFYDAKDIALANDIGLLDLFVRLDFMQNKVKVVLRDVESSVLNLPPGSTGDGFDEIDFDAPPGPDARYVLQVHYNPSGCGMSPSCVHPADVQVTVGTKAGVVAAGVATSVTIRTPNFIDPTVEVQSVPVLIPRSGVPPPQ